MANRPTLLELGMVDQLRAQGVNSLELNVWQSVPIRGQMVPREADIKISIGGGRKVVVLCDGEAFHGPRMIFGNPQDRILADTETAEAYYALGYSVVRYSETEIKSGVAVKHMLDVLKRLDGCRAIYRNWCPSEERVSSPSTLHLIHLSVGAEYDKQAN